MGFVSVTSEVDLGPLDQSFVLESYHHLRHPAPPSLGTPTTVWCTLVDVLSLSLRVRLEVSVSAEYCNQ